MDEVLESINPAIIKSADYQRPINRGKVDYYKELVNDSPRYLLPTATIPIISFRDNSYYCIDGQHRILAMAEDEVTEAQFLVKHGLSYNEEKKLYLAHWVEKTGGVIPK